LQNKIQSAIEKHYLMNS